MNLILLIFILFIIFYSFILLYDFDIIEKARPGAVAGDRTRPKCPVELPVVVLGLRADPDHRAEALPAQIQLLVGQGVAADQVLQSGKNLDRVRLIELEFGDVAEEGQNGLEIGSPQGIHASKYTLNGE